MNIAALKSRTELCGLKIIRTKIISEGNLVQLFVEGGPIFNVYRGETIKLVWRNLELLKGVFPDNFEISRAVSDYIYARAETRKLYEIVATTDNPFTCRDLTKAIRKLNVNCRIKIDR